MKKEKLKQKFITYFIFCMIVILIANHSIERNLPSVYNDEFGYWASAAYFSGYDWSDIFSQIQYYSYGYGLLLSLLIFISKSTQTAYRLALSLNGLWIGLSFLVLNLICKKLYPNMQFKKRIIISLISTFFASNVVQLNYTWPECLLYLLFCMNFYLILMLNEKITYIKLIVLSALLILEYAIHQRTLSIILATLLTVGLLIFQKGHDSRKKVCFYFLRLYYFFSFIQY